PPRALAPAAPVALVPAAPVVPTVPAVPAETPVPAAPVVPAEPAETPVPAAPGLPPLLVPTAPTHPDARARRQVSPVFAKMEGVGKASMVLSPLVANLLRSRHQIGGQSYAPGAVSPPC